MKSTKSTSATHTKATAGKKYYYKVKAIAKKSKNNSKFSSVKSKVCEYKYPITVKVALSGSNPKVTWNKVTGAKKYTIYMRKRYAKKWYKVKTVSGKKASYTIKKFRGKKVNAYRQNYEVKVKATAKIGGKTYNSTSDDYIYTYTYTRYR